MAEQRAPVFFLALIVIATLLLAIVMRPIAKELLLAAVLASMLWPVQQWLTRHLGGRRAIAASLIAFRRDRAAARTDRDARDLRDSRRCRRRALRFGGGAQR